MASSLGLTRAKVWKTADIFRATDGGEMLVSILKLSHPHRKQQITLIPIPRVASGEYYKEWVYQPYAKESVLYVSNEIFVPTSTFVPRILLRRNFFPGFEYFTPAKLPDSVDMNISRAELYKREKSISGSGLKITMLLNTYRDRRHRWLPKRLRSIVGERYVTHPRESEQSLVLMLPPGYAATSVNTFQSLGFTVADRVDVPCGKADELLKLTQYAQVGQTVAVCYLWFLLLLVVWHQTQVTMEAFAEYKRDVIRKAGRDPSEFGL